MKPPKELLGKEAKPLISMIGEICTYANPMSKVVILANFLNRDFTPDMIEYFKGANEMLFDTEFLRKQKTLDQFITACNNSDIKKLTYKDE